MYLCSEIVLNFTYNMDSRILSIICATLFLVLSVALHVVIIPSKNEYNDYKKSRRILSSGFLLIASAVIIRLLCFPPTSEVGFHGFIAVVSLSLLFNSLNFISFLYMIETSRPKRKMLKKIAIVCVSILAALGMTGVIIPAAQFYLKIAMSIVYMFLTIVLFTRSIREYDKFILQMDNFYEDELNIRWIPGLLWITFALAMAMIGAFYYKHVSIVTGVSSAIVYTIVAMKMLSFVPENIHVVRKNIRTHEIIAEDHGEHIHIFPIDGPVAPTGKPAEEIAATDEKEAKRNEKIALLIERWVLLENYVRADINIKDAASEMGTNTSYLSAYLNKVMNVSFAMWLNTLRVEKSKEYLCGEQKISVEECGIRVGYQSISNYSRWFKTITGMSPLQWRKTRCSTDTATK